MDFDIVYDALLKLDSGLPYCCANHLNTCELACGDVAVRGGESSYYRGHNDGASRFAVQCISQICLEGTAPFCGSCDRSGFDCSFEVAGIVDGYPR